MFKKIKKLINLDKKSFEIKPVFKNNSISFSVFENGKELDWDSLSVKEQQKYKKLIDDKYSNMQVPLSEFSPKVAPRETIEEYSHPFIDMDILIDALDDWTRCPGSHPAIDKWCQDGCPDIKRFKTQEEIDFEEYSPIFMEARSLKDEDPLAALEKYTHILKNYKPIGLAYYTEPADLFCRLCRYDEAMFCLGIAKENIYAFRGRTQSHVLEEFPRLISEAKIKQSIFGEVIKVVKDSPGIIQSEVYKLINADGNKARFIIYNMANTGFLKREKHGTSYKLYPTDMEMNTNYLIGF